MSTNQDKKWWMYLNNNKKKITSNTSLNISQQLREITFEESHNITTKTNLFFKDNKLFCEYHASFKTRYYLHTYNNEFFKCEISGQFFLENEIEKDLYDRLKINYKFIEDEYFIALRKEYDNISTS